MTAVHGNSTDLGESDTLVPALRTAHETWIRETDSFLAPVIVPGAPFWDRWTAVRYMADQFLGQYRRELALVNELRPFLPAQTSESLVRDGKRIGELLAELDRVGRRRGTARSVANSARRLLDSLRLWCADIEAAAWRIPRDVLPEEGARVVAALERYSCSQR
jgi:hypothetical protein